jgi:hypothetical protein
MSGLRSGGTALCLLPCPDVPCGAVAEVVDRITVGSTDGPIEHVRTRCLDGHAFFLPASRVLPPSTYAMAGEPIGSDTRPPG